VQAQVTKGETVATRKASQQAIEAYAKVLPEMLGGSADLTDRCSPTGPAADGDRRGRR
jgi:transketolase